MISFDEAVAIVRSAARPRAAERVSLQDASAHVLAQPVIAAIDSPRTDVSAMDGYAVRDDDAVLGATLRIVGQSLPGAGWPGMVGSGTCVRVFTGAPLPDGAERVVIQEHVSRDGETARITSDPGPARWLRGRGGDFKQGDLVLPAGRLLDPAALIAAAGADVAEIQAYRRPQIALISSGDELVEPGQAHDTALAVPDSVAIGLVALAGQWGGEIVSRARLRDDLDSMIAAARAAVENADVVVVSGGASVGKRDFAKTMFEPLGIELSFSKVSIRQSDVGTGHCAAIPRADAGAASGARG
jgi:molybdopterin molybdotransferase